MLATIPDARQQKRLEALRPRLEKQLRGYFHNARIKHAVDGSGLAATLAAYPPKPYGAHAAAVERARAELVTAASVATSTTRTRRGSARGDLREPGIRYRATRLRGFSHRARRSAGRADRVAVCRTANRRGRTARARADQSHHDDQLVGPLGPYIQKKGRRFERGFLASCVTRAARCSRGAYTSPRGRPFARSASRVVRRASSPVSCSRARCVAVRVLRGLEHGDARELASDRIEEISYRVCRMAHATIRSCPTCVASGSHPTYDRASETDLVARPLWRRLERFAINDGFERLPLMDRRACDALRG